MLAPVCGFLCLWLCAEAAQFRAHSTKDTLSPGPGPAAYSRRWRTAIGEDHGGTLGANARASWMVTADPQPPERPGAPTVRHAAGDRTLHAGVNGPADALTLSPHGHSCSPGGSRHTRSPRARRTRRSERRQDGALPAAGAQEQEAGPPFGLNASDYEEDLSSPDLSDSTRSRRRPVRNPFYPLTAEACGAYALTIVAAVVFSVGIVGNVSVMCIVCHNYYMRSISNSLLANLALWDFLLVFFCLPLVLLHELTRKWLLGDFSCRIIPYLEVASLGVTTFTLCALCIDRFRAATNVEMYYETTENWASTTAKLAVIWAGALLLALPELLIRQLVKEDGEQPDETPCERCVVRISTDLPDTLYVLGLTYDGARLWWYFGCYFCLPTLFTICGSLVTARKIRQVERSRVRGSKRQIQLESQMNCAVVALAILYGFCIIPENICNIVGAYMAADVPRRTLDVLQLVSQLLLFCKSAVTPLLLFGLCQPFTRAFLSCCCCCCDECVPPRSPAAAELELSPSGREASNSATCSTVGTHC